MKARVVEKEKDFQSIDELSVETQKIIKEVSIGKNIVGPYKTVNECFNQNKLKVRESENNDLEKN